MTIQENSHLKRLEAEAIHIFREVAAEFERPAMMYSWAKIHLSCCIWPAKLSILRNCLSR